MFIADARQAEVFYESGIANGIFMPAEEWLSAENLDKERAEKEASDYFVKIDNLSFFEAEGVKPESAYVAVRKIREEEKEEEYEKTKEAAIILANYLLGI